MGLTSNQRTYWRRNKRVTVVLLGIWFVVTYVSAFFARELNDFTLFGFPLGFYMGAQGVLIVYVFIIWYYAHYMDKLDEKHGVREGDR